MADPLAALEVLDVLEVGPARVERNAVVTPYRVAGAAGEAVHELAYRYDEDVFDPSSESDVNLASMITAQVAVNYGLFAKRLVFQGPFDDEDQRFLRAMLANTAREIFVKKFLQPNPFLDDAVRHLPPVKASSYVRGEVVFSGSGGVRPAARPAADGHGMRYAVLSSGGKDSLLSYGLLHELGHEVHPIFLNESGRHWFTALNAYRDFFDFCHRNLVDGGRLSLQTIAAVAPDLSAPFIAEKIFPDSELPLIWEPIAAAEEKFELTALRNDGEHYYRTLRIWERNLAARRQQAVALVGEVMVADFQRYLRLSAAGFGTRLVCLLRMSFLKRSGGAGWAALSRNLA